MLTPGVGFKGYSQYSHLMSDSAGDSILTPDTGLRGYSQYRHPVSDSEGTHNTDTRCRIERVSVGWISLTNTSD